MTFKVSILASVLFFISISLPSSVFAQSIPTESKIYQSNNENSVLVKLEKVESLSSFGVFQRYSAIEAKNLFAVNKTVFNDKTSFLSQRNLKHMKAGTSYRAVFGVYQNTVKIDEVIDLIHLSFSLLADESEKGPQKLFATQFKADQNNHEYHSHVDQHQFLFFIPAGTVITSLNFKLKSQSPPIMMKVFDEEEHVIEKHTISGNQDISMSITGPSMALIELSFAHHESDYFFSIDGTISENFEDREFSRGPLGLACKKATKAQKRTVNRGNKKKADFLKRCAAQTSNSDWCQQVIRPNPGSRQTFRCTYGSNQVHQLIHPLTSTWKNAIESIKIIEELTASGIKTCRVSNWWRPEPYNKNVGGSPTRHPYGTAVDVLFCSKDDQNKAFRELCKMRKRGRIRAIGYYGNPTLHFGIGDRRGNTWGKACP